MLLKALLSAALRRRNRVTMLQCALLIVAFVLGAYAVTIGTPGVARAQGPGGPGPGGFGRGGPGAAELKLVEQFDRNKDDLLDADERKTAREWLAANGAGRGRGFGGRGFGGRGMEPSAPGRALSTADVRPYPNTPIYDINTLRTIFLKFENTDWEQELAAFKNTDVEVPATVIVDGRTYKQVGVHFRGASSFMMVPEGSKRSLNVAFDFVNEQQNVGGYRTLNLLNATSDPTFVRGLLYAEIARSYIPAPKTNYMRVVINGESWGIYLNAQQYNKDFLRDYFKTETGARWKVPGGPGGRGGMEYLGEAASLYKRIYEIKSRDDPKSWADLIRMFRVLNETPADKLEAALSPLLNIDGALKFLAIEMALVNTDGYWTRASDYNIYEDEKGRFHIIPHDMNEALMVEGGRGRGPGGPGGPPPDGRGFPPDFLRGGPGGGRGFGPRASVDLDPLIGLDDPAKPLRSKLLAVPAFRARYLSYVRDIAQRWLDWKKLEPMLTQYRKLIAEDVRADTRKLYSFDAFQTGFNGPENSLQSFVQRRRDFLLNVTDPNAAMK